MLQIPTSSYGMFVSLLSLSGPVLWCILDLLLWSNCWCSRSKSSNVGKVPWIHHTENKRAGNLCNWKLHTSWHVGFTGLSHTVLCAWQPLFCSLMSGGCKCSTNPLSMHENECSAMENQHQELSHPTRAFWRERGTAVYLHGNLISPPLTFSIVHVPSHVGK